MQGKPLFQYLDFPGNGAPRAAGRKSVIGITTQSSGNGGVWAQSIAADGYRSTQHTALACSQYLLSVPPDWQDIPDNLFALSFSVLSLSFLINDSRHHTAPISADQAQSPVRIQNAPLLTSHGSQQTSAHHRQGSFVSDGPSVRYHGLLCLDCSFWRFLNFKCLIIQWGHLGIRCILSPSPDTSGIATRFRSAFFSRNTVCPPAFPIPVCIHCQHISQNSNFSPAIHSTSHTATA